MLICFYSRDYMINFERLCKDYKNIENYKKAKADDFKNWVCHHRLQTWTSDEHRKKMSDVKKDISDETRKKMSDAKKGKNNPHYGKQLSEEHKKKLSEASKGNTRNKGRCWFNNGVTEKFCFKCPEGFVFGRLSWKNN